MGSKRHLTTANILSIGAPILDSGTRTYPPESSLALPLYLCGISSLILLIHLILQIPLLKRLTLWSRDLQREAHKSDNAEIGQGLPASIPGYVKQTKLPHDGPKAFPYHAARLVLCLTLLALSMYAAVLDHNSEHGEKDSMGFGQWLRDLTRPQIAQAGLFLYASLLAHLTILSRPIVVDTTSRHLAILLFAAFSVLFYRNIVPLGTFTSSPADNGWLNWSRFGLLAIAGVFIPLCIPRKFAPEDPLQHQKPLPSAPAQTASILSLATFSFVNSVVFKARQGHIPYEELPVMTDIDHIDYLHKTTFPDLDPTQEVHGGRHFAFRLLWIYRWDFAQMIAWITIKIMASLMGPVAINQLLAYIETRGQDAIVRSWVWVLALFLAPVATSIAWQWYAYKTVQIIVRTEGIITQLIFEHALKIRLNDETQSEDSGSVKTMPAVVAPQTEHGNTSDESVTHSSDENSGTTMVVGETESPTNSDTPSVGSQTKEHAKPIAEGSNLIGNMTNLVSTDLGNITDARDFLLLFFMAPVQLVVSMYFLYQLFDWAAFVGLAAMVITLPIPGKAASLVNWVQEERMKKTDARVQSITETISIIRMVKLFGWEDKFERQVTEKREAELIYLAKKQLYGLVSGVLSQALPLATMIAMFATYTLVMKQALNTSKIFSAIAVFDQISMALSISVWEIPCVISAKVSLDRVNTFLNQTELLDRFSQPSNEAVMLSHVAEIGSIGFRNAAFSWKSDIPSSSGATTPSRRNFQLRIDDDLLFHKDKLNLIIGPTGSGKTSLLMALLGEMHLKRERVDSYVNLPREGGVAYCAQEPWIQNSTIKENILFGAPFKSERYNKVLYQCALEHDLTLFEAGDDTEVGEKGLTLSGGQKARIALARALYSTAQIVLLDDVLSALDVHTSHWIVEKCLSGDLLKGRTVLLVTHNVTMTGPIGEYVVALSSNGRIVSRGSVSEALRADPELRSDIITTDRAAEAEEEIIDPKQTMMKDVGRSSGQLVAKEDILEGRVSWHAFKFFFDAFGGPVFWVIFVGTWTLCEIFKALQVWWIGHWARQYESHLPEDVNATWYLSIYAASIAATIIFFNTGFVAYVYASLRGERAIHAKLTRAVLGSTLRWLDSTPTGRIISRFTRDMQAVDGPVTSSFNDVVQIMLNIATTLVAILIYSPVFVFPGIIVAIIGAMIGRMYMTAQLSVKREMSNARSPIYSNFGASIAGLVTIRAFGVEGAFRTESRNRIDYYSRPAHTYWNLNRWISIRMDTLGALFGASLAAYLVYRPGVDAGTTGFSLAMASNFTSVLLWAVRITNDFEVQANSLERIKGYVDIDQEPAPTEAGKPPAYWPSSGSIRVEGLSARYSSDGPEVLHDVTFEVRAGERVGVVGRTGAGKSSLSLALLRMIPTTGKVYYDGMDTSKLNLHALRSNVTIIPQQPELMSGTLRQNLDPFGEHDDATLNSALRSAGLFTLQQQDDDDKIGLDSSVASGGTNFSVGQRQIIALARAMVRRSKVYILDEATASVDNKTDTAIQKVIASEFNDTTLIIVAHRLQTVMSVDKVLVLDAGKVVEFGSPAALLNKGGMFKSLVDGSGDRDTLYGLVERRN
ncbi:hypothetical protein FRB94_006059 [Tulasnella sp. JGI-2019a]|nr:hypothetical protein FRB94_006059 [Tulasnella sp. JGI-2019a]